MIKYSTGLKFWNHLNFNRKLVDWVFFYNFCVVLLQFKRKTEYKMSSDWLKKERKLDPNDSVVFNILFLCAEKQQGVGTVGIYQDLYAFVVVVVAVVMLLFSFISDF